MKNLMAKDVMVESVVTIKKSALAKDAVTNLLYGSFSGLPVIDEDNKLVGIVTEFDMLDATLQGKDLETTRIYEIMTKDVHTASQDTPVMEIAKIMKEKNLIRIPILEGEKLVGIVGRCDILKGLMQPKLVRR
jgi:CBS domain-containing protein